jgi:hypothetical protein
LNLSQYIWLWSRSNTTKFGTKIWTFGTFE